MKNLKKINSNIIALKHRIKIIEEKSNEKELFIEFHDLDNFYEVLDIDILNAEQTIRNTILNLDKERFDILINKMILDIEKYLIFYDTHSEQLQNFDIHPLIDKQLSYNKYKLDQAYESLKKASFKRTEVNNNLEAAFLKYNDNDPKKKRLQIELNLVKKECNEFDKIYSKQYNDYHNLHIEYSKYFSINFKKLYVRLKKIKDLIEKIILQPDSISNNNYNIVSMEICGIFYRLTKELLNKSIDDNTLAKILNLSYTLPQPIDLKRGATEKFLYVIKCTSEILSLDKVQKNEWENDLIKNLGLKMTTYRRGSLVSNNNVFTKEIKSSFRHFKS